ncbi:MAG: anhydro-N-acetylmuramic acid kinase [Rhodospirillaceae bacterium]|nr:anhydro-N-acetylmuramic acid kinase [Rhodospirillaceae bacterium]
MNVAVIPFKPLRVVGLMSGTSMDGIDAAYMETDGDRIIWRGSAVTLPYPPEFRARLGAFIAAAPDRGVSKLEAGLEGELTDRHGAAVAHLLAVLGLANTALDLVGFHGQTIWHRPTSPGRGLGATWQMGDGPRLAGLLGVPVAFDFRSADVAAGGQGAPLVPVYHAALAQGDRPMAILNVGGVANLTWIGRGSEEVLGFDTGPGNGLIDDWLKEKLGLAMDRDGALAAKGRVHRDLIARMIEHPFFARHPPKSLDRFDFTLREFAHLGVADGAATLTAFTAACAAESLKHCPERPKKIFVTGGGRHNPTLMAELARQSGILAAPVDELGWDGDALEAEAFAYLAVRCLRRMPLTYPGTTGVTTPVTGGRIAAPVEGRH